MTSIPVVIIEVCIESWPVFKAVRKWGDTPHREFNTSVGICEIVLLAWTPVMEAQSSLPAACFYPDKILVLSAVQCEVLMHVQCMAETQRSELKEQIHNDTNTRMTQTSGNTIRSVDSQMVLGGRGKLGCRHQTVSPCLGGLERVVEGSVATEKQWGRKIYWSLSPFSHLFPLPSTALAKLPMNFPTLSSWLFSLKSCCALLPDGFSYAPVLPLCQAHH